MSEDGIRDMVRVSREILCSIWEKCQAGQALTAEEERIASLLREHEEYRSAWEIGNVIMDSRYTVGGVNPFLHIHLHLTVENQLRANDPPEIAKVVAELQEKGYPRHEALHAVASILLDEIYDIMRDKRPFDREKYVNATKQLLKREGKR